MATLWGQALAAKLWRSLVLADPESVVSNQAVLSHQAMHTLHHRPTSSVAPTVAELFVQGLAYLHHRQAVDERLVQGLASDHTPALIVEVVVAAGGIAYHHVLQHWHLLHT